MAMSKDEVNVSLFDEVKNLQRQKTSLKMWLEARVKGSINETGTNLYFREVLNKMQEFESRAV